MFAVVVHVEVKRYEVLEEHTVDACKTINDIRVSFTALKFSAIEIVVTDIILAHVN